MAIITIKGEIRSGITSASFIRRLKDAEASGADAIVVELDTPGGEVGAVLEICDALKSSSIKNTVAWVHPNAYSGGAIIALACREIVASDPATIGDALPVITSMGFLNSLPEHERQKFVSPLVAEVVDSARRYGYDEYLVQGFVSRGVELWLVEDARTGERLTIDRAEYALLFDGDPPDSRPRLVSAQGSRPRGIRNASPPDSPSDSSVPGLIPDAPAETPVSPGSAKAPPTSPGPSDRPDTSFRPASPSLGAIADDVSQGLDLGSNRPFITEADRGHYRLIEYVSDGQGPIVMKHGDMGQFGFLEATIASDDEIAAYFGATTIRRLDPSWSEVFAGLMTTRLVRFVLIAVFLVALFIELTHPGVTLPGAIAVIALVGLVGPPMMIGMANWWEVAAIVGGLVFIGVEIFVLPGFTVFGALGLLSLFAGLVGTFVKQEPGHLFPDSPQGGQDMLYGVVTILLSCVSAVVAMYFIGKHFGSLPIISRMVLGDPTESDELMLAINPASGSPVTPGQTGSTITPLRPAGRAMIGDQMVDVVAEVGFIESGVPVRVVEASAFRIVVARSARSSGENA